MSGVLAIAFALVPFALLVLAYLWAFHLRARAALLGRIARALLPAAAAVLAVGDAVNGFSRAEGFHAGYFSLGVAFVAALCFAVFLMPRWRSPTSLARSFLAVIREDFREPTRVGAGHRWSSLVAFTLFAVIFYLASMTALKFNFQYQAFVFEYLDAIRRVAERTPLLDFMTKPRCEGTELYNPFTFILYGFIEHIDAGAFSHIRLLLVAAIVGLNLWLHRHRSSLMLLASSLFVLAVTLDWRYDFNSSAFFETFFALLFFVNFLMLLHMRLTRGFAFATGLVNGVAFATKEIAVLNVAVLAWILATSGLDKRRFVAVAGSAVAGFAIASLFFFRSFLECGISEGLYHLPVAWFRGAQMEVMGQARVYLLADQGVQFPFVDLVLRRLSFQTVGEILFGACRRFGLMTLTGVFPLAYLAANLPGSRMRAVWLFLVLGFPLYGITYWKGGDSADPLYTMLPFGFIYAAPFLVRVVSRLAESVRRGTLLRPRVVYLWLLLAVNVLFLASLVEPAATTARRARTIEGISRSGVTFSSELTAPQRAFIEFLEDLRREGRAEDWIFINACFGRDEVDFVMRSNVNMVFSQLDARFELLAAVLAGDRGRVREALDLMVREVNYHRPDGGAFHVLVCTPKGPGPGSKANPYAGRRFLEGCASIPYADVVETRLAVVAFDVDACRNLISPGLLTGDGLRQGRAPAIPLVPENSAVQ